MSFTSQKRPLVNLEESGSCKSTSRVRPRIAANSQERRRDPQRKGGQFQLRFVIPSTDQGFPSLGWVRAIGTRIILFLFLLAVSDVLAAAGQLDLTRVAPFNNLASSRELKQDYINLSTKPYGREDLAISLLVPKEWRDIKITVAAGTLDKATEIFIPITEQRTPELEAGNALVQVLYHQLEMEIGLSDVVDAFLESSNLEVLMRRQGRYSGRDVDEVLARAVQEGETYLARLTFSRHGARVFLVNGSVKEAYVDRFAKVLGIAAVSLKVKQKSTSEFVQPMLRFSSKGKPELSFRYPASLWSVAEQKGPRAGVTTATLTLRVTGDTPGQGNTYASIYAEAVEKSEKTSPEQMFKDLKAVFVSTGFSFDTRLLMADIEPRLSAPLGKLERWAVTLDGLPAEVTLLLLPRGNRYIGMGLFSMRRSDNLFAWMTAGRVFEIVVGDLTGKKRSLSAFRKLVMPLEKELNQMLSETLSDFALAVSNSDFSAFHTKMAQLSQSQVTREKLYRSFSGFAGEDLDPVFYRQTAPRLVKPPYVQSDGVLVLEGYYPSRPLRTHFKLSYLYEDSAWKLLVFNIVLREGSTGSKTE